MNVAIKNKCLILITTSILVLMQVFPATAQPSQTDISRPNIIIILSDDVGYADIGAFGDDVRFSTPNIDRIAENGVKFTQGYVSASVCSPSRAGLLTGRYQHRFGHEDNLPRNPQPGDMEKFMGLPTSEITLAAQLKKQGYHTGIIGKWHLGEQKQFHPLNRGFDEFYGFLAGSHSYFQEGENDGNNPIYHNRRRVKEFPYLTEAFGTAATTFIEKNKKRPFFLYVAFNAAHTPLQAKEKDLQKVKEISNPKRRKYAAMMLSLDRQVGNMLDKLQTSNLSKETIVFYLNDNGGTPPYNASSNAPLRGMKGTLLEGGVRVPFMVQWPGHFPKGKEFNKVVSSLDIFPTAVAAAGGELPDGRPYDGVNLLPYLRGKRNGPVHDALFWRRKAFAAVRSGPWKMIRFPDRPAELYNINKDKREKKNVADQHPELVKKLYQKLYNWEKELQNPLWQTNSMWTNHSLKLYDQQYIIENSWLSEQN